MNRSMVVALALAVAGTWAAMAAGVTAVWLTEEVRLVGLMLLPAAVVAVLLVLYFDWRANLHRLGRAERHVWQPVQSGTADSDGTSVCSAYSASEGAHPAIPTVR